MIDYNSKQELSHTLHDPGVLNVCVSRKDMAWLESESGRQQFLTWLVQGAVRWYQNGRTLGALPSKLQTALDAYLDQSHNDGLLPRFIRERCMQEEGIKESRKAMHAAFVAFEQEQGVGASTTYADFNLAMRQLYPQFVPDKRTRSHRDQGQEGLFVCFRLARTAQARADYT